MLRRAFGSVALVCVGVAWTACVGDDPSVGGGPAIGDRLGDCFSDGNCKTGFECRLPERICLASGEGLPNDASGGNDGDGSGDDGGIDANEGGDSANDGGDGASASDGDAGDSGNDADGGVCTIPKVSSGTYCPGTASGCSTGCCVGNGGALACASGGSCAAGAAPFACDNAADCFGGSGYECCLNPAGDGATPVPKMGCSSALYAGESVCLAGTCVGAQRKLCIDNAGCNGGTCVPI